MPTLLLTFLGTGNYQPCRYQISGAVQAEASPFFSVALAHNLRPDKVISLQTTSAAAKHGYALDNALRQSGISHEPVSIPDGQSEAELWQIFAGLTAHIPEGCTLHLDITHGFRSLPVLGFIALSYLRVTRRVTIGGVHYGAWEALDQATNTAPAFDLTPFLTLLDWSAAADQFLATGSAARLGDLLAQTQQTLWQNTGKEATVTELPRKLKSLGASLQESSANLLLLRTGQLAAASAKLGQTLAAARAEVGVHASPFLELLEPVRSQLTRFGSTDLATLRELVGWLAARGQTAATLTLASEWLTSYVMITCGQPCHHAGFHARKPYSLAVSKLSQPEIQLDEDETGCATLAHLETLRAKLSETEIRTLSTLGSTIRLARNDLNHAGFNEQSVSASTLQQRALRIAAELQQLPLP